MRGAVLGPYRILETLGQGGMGTVYLAEVVSETCGLAVGTQVALKLLHPHLVDQTRMYRRFLQEGRIGKRVRHENVVRTYDGGSAPYEGRTQRFLVMEYVRGQTLRDLLEEMERLPEQLCLHIACEVAKALGAIHEADVVHRDLKPENVLVTEEQQIRVMDLGVARLGDDGTRISDVGTFVGSLDYACPEQFRPDVDAVDGRADLHALGVMLYELATGQHPFRDDDVNLVLKRVVEDVPRRAGIVNPQLSPFLEEVVHTLMEKDRDLRFPSAAALLETLEQGEQSAWWKGRARALRLEARRPLRRVRIPRDTALYGRDAELADLDAAWARARAGDGQVLLLGGEAGIGKTRLVDEFVGRLEDEGESLDFLVGAYPPGGAATAAGAFSTAYREQFGAEGLEETLSRYLADTPILIPGFAALLRGEPLPEGATPLSKESMQTAFVRATQTLAANRPTLILIDDLHFAPEEGRALFASLALAAPGHRILLVGTMRRGVPESWTADVERLDHAARIDLPRLGAKDLVHLLEDAFRSKRLAEALGVKIAVKSDGNPFFVFEIIRGLREDSAIAKRPDGTWVTTRVIDDVQVPASIADLIYARISDLDDTQRHLLEVASCCGFEFDGRIVAAAMGAERIPTFRRLGHLEHARRIVRSAGRRFVFDHHQIQEVLYEGLPVILREEYHGEIGKALESEAAGRLGAKRPVEGALAVDLCGHYLRARRGAEALTYLDAALEHLQGGYLNDQAAALARRALDIPGLLEGARRASVLLRLAEQLHPLGRRAEQEAAARESLDLARALGEPTPIARALSILSAGLCATAHFDEARGHLEESLALAQAAGDQWEATRSTGNLGVVFLDTGNFAEAEACFLEALEGARAAGERLAETRVLGNLGNAALGRSRIDEAASWFEQQMTLAREQGDVHNEAYAMGGLGNVQLHQGRFEEARASFEREVALCVATGDRRVEAVAHGNLAFALRCLGLYDVVRRHAERHLEIALEIRDLWSQCRAYDLRSTVALELGRVREARAVAGAWLDLAEEIKDPRQATRALSTLARVADVAAEPALALTRYGQSIEQRRARGDQLGEARDRCGRARVRHETGDLTGAIEDLEVVLATTAEVDAPTLRLEAAARRSLLPGGEVEPALDAVAACEARTPLARRIEPRWLLWQATGDRVHLEEARRLLSVLCDHAPGEATRSVVENVRTHAAVRAARR